MVCLIDIYKRIRAILAVVIPSNVARYCSLPLLAAGCRTCLPIVRYKLS